MRCCKKEIEVNIYHKFTHTSIPQSIEITLDIKITEEELEESNHRKSCEFQSAKEGSFGDWSSSTAPHVKNSTNMRCLWF
jgi:hypothetical protein